MTSLYILIPIISPVVNRLLTLISRDLFDTLVRIEVGTGEEKRTFEVYKGVLCFYSDYFNAALRGRFVEAQENIARLPTEDATIFDYFCTWIHKRYFFESTLAPFMLFPFDSLLKLWVFGDAHDVPMLQNEAGDMILRKIVDSRNFPSAEDLCYVCDSTLEDTPLRNLLTYMFEAICGRELKWSSLDSEGRMMTMERSGELLMPWKAKIRTLPSSVYHCTWHVHEDGAKCPNALLC